MKRIFIVVHLLWATFFYAQETTGKLEGKITDTTGNPIIFASVLVVDMETNFKFGAISQESGYYSCLLYTSPSPRDQRGSRMPSSA